MLSMGQGAVHQGLGPSTIISLHRMRSLAGCPLALSFAPIWNCLLARPGLAERGTRQSRPSSGLGAVCSLSTLVFP